MPTLSFAATTGGQVQKFPPPKKKRRLALIRIYKLQRDGCLMEFCQIFSVWSKSPMISGQCIQSQKKQIRQRFSHIFPICQLPTPIALHSPLTVDLSPSSTSGKSHPRSKPHLRGASLWGLYARFLVAKHCWEDTPATWHSNTRNPEKARKKKCPSVDGGRNPGKTSWGW